MKEPVGDIGGVASPAPGVRGSAFTTIGPPSNGFSDTPDNQGTEKLDASRVAQAPATYLICGWLQKIDPVKEVGPDAEPWIQPVEKRLTVVKPLAYQGRSGRRLSMGFWIAGENVLNMGFNVKFRCRAKNSFPISDVLYFATFALGPGGRMKLDATGGDRSAKLRGVVRGKRASGTLTATLKTSDGNCRTGRLRWRARRVKWKG